MLYFISSILYTLHNFSVPRDVRDALSTIHSYIHHLIVNTNITTNSSLLNSIPDYHLTFHTLSYPFLPFSSLGLDNYSPFMLLLLRLLQTFISLFVSILFCYQILTMLYRIYCTEIHIYPYLSHLTMFVSLHRCLHSRS